MVQSSEYSLTLSAVSDTQPFGKAQTAIGVEPILVALLAARHFSDFAHLEIGDVVGWMHVVDVARFVCIEVHAQVMAAVFGNDAGLALYDDAPTDGSRYAVMHSGVIAIHRVRPSGIAHRANVGDGFFRESNA